MISSNTFGCVMLLTYILESKFGDCQIKHLKVL